MLLIRDIMTESVLVLTEGTPLLEAATTLSNMGVSGAPVCDPQGRVIGVVSKSDIVAKLADGRSSAELRVGDLMTSKVFSVRPGDVLGGAIRRFVAENIHRLMVVDEEQHLLGILTPMDVLKAIVEGKLSVQGLEEDSPDEAP